MYRQEARLDPVNFCDKGEKYCKLSGNLSPALQRVLKDKDRIQCLYRLLYFKCKIRPCKN
ncbi:hypothetical protein GCM10009411_04560 [Shewanella litoralis]|uniref:Uncharacterized protein n=1 Tax=Shewanella litoralis TaxID=2282700 RepID=A0ABQ2R0A5_9GAMM|nr:hypothetical protein GCM10009411_04560 [Shewanella litoralis]